MENREIIETAGELIQLETQAAQAYGCVADEFTVPSVRLRIMQFHHDHERHAALLRESLHRFDSGLPEGLEAPEINSARELIYAVRHARGMEDVLKTLRAYEKFTNEMYGAVDMSGLPDDIAFIVRSNSRDEQRHLKYIDETIEEQVRMLGEMHKTD